MEERQREEFNTVYVYPNKHKCVKIDPYNLVFKTRIHQLNWELETAFWAQVESESRDSVLLGSG